MLCVVILYTIVKRRGRFCWFFLMQILVLVVRCRFYTYATRSYDFYLTLLQVEVNMRFPIRLV